MSNAQSHKYTNPESPYQVTSLFAKKATKQVILQTQVNMVRNIRDEKFSGTMSSEERSSLFTKIETCFNQVVAKHGAEVEWYNCKQFNMPTDDYFLPHFIESYHWEKPDAFSRQGRLVTSNGDQHHVQFQLLNYDHVNLWHTVSGFNPETAFEQVLVAERLVGQSLPFAFTPERGYLTSEPLESGNAMTVSVLAAVPALVQFDLMPGIIRAADKFGVRAVKTVWAQEDKTLPEVLYTFSCKYQLGVNETEAIAILRRFVGMLVLAELRQRLTWRYDHRLHFLDQLLRVEMTLNVAQLMDQYEATSLLVRLLCFFDMGCISSTTRKTILKALTWVQPEYMLVMKAVPSEDRSEVDSDDVDLQYAQARANKVQGMFPTMHVDVHALDL